MGVSAYGEAMSVAGAPAAPLIRTKVHGPLPRTLVPRPALLDRLVHGPARKLTLIRSQAGWGKSSVLAAWSAADPRPFAWLALDPGDNDPVRFWRYVGKGPTSFKLGRKVLYEADAVEQWLTEAQQDGSPERRVS